MNERFRYAIDIIKRHERHRCQHEIVLPFDTRHRLAVLEMTDTFASKGDVLLRVTLVVSFLHRVEFVVLGALQLCVGEAVTVHLLQLEDQVVERIGLTSLFGHKDHLKSVHLLRCLAVVRQSSCERSIGVESEFRETVIEHFAHQVTHSVEHILLCGTLQHLGQLVELILERDTATFGFGVGDDRYERFVVMVDGVDRTLSVVSATRHICPKGLYLRFNTVHVDVADYDDRLIVGTVPFMVVVTECLVLEVIDDGGVADDIAFRVLRTRVHELVQFLPYTSACGTSGSPLLEDHATLGIDLLVQKEQTATPVMHDQQRTIDDTGTVGRHVRETIDGLVDGGISVDVTTEIHTHGLEIIDDSFAREMLGTIERHVLQEVRQTVLMILLEDGTHGLCDMELSTLFRLLVMTDVISQSVVQLAVTNLRVDRQFLRRLLRRKAHCYE